LRSALAAIEEWLVSVRRACDNPGPGDPSYPDFLATDPFSTFSWKSDAQRATAQRLLDELKALGASLEDAGDDAPSVNAPRPRPEVRLRPRI
jgi:hypothetical protein